MGHRAQQPRRVRMLRRVVEVERGRGLHDLARVHHDDPVGQLDDQPEVVGDEQDAAARLVAEPGQQRDDLRLDGHVERGGGLVRDEQLRLAGQRHRDHGPLPHPARELVRVVLDAAARVRDPDEIEHLGGPGERGAPRAALVPPVHLGDLVADGERRVQARHRLLEDHRDLVAADVAQLLRRHVDQVPALVQHPSGRGARVRVRQQPQHREARDALARTRLADQAHDLTGPDVEGHARDDVRPPAIGQEVDMEIVDLQQRAAVPFPLHHALPFWGTTPRPPRWKA